MKYSRITLATLVGITITAFTSCVTEPVDVDYDAYEQLVLSEWIEAYVPEATYWSVEDEDYGYYTIYQNEDTIDTSETPIYTYEDCWVKYNLTGYNLEGSVCVTRNELVAYQIGAFDELIRYCPLYQDLFYDEEDYYDEDTYDYLPECIKLALQNEDLCLRKGSVLTMYIPSEIIDGASEGEDGFAGNVVLSVYQPLRAEIEIVDVIPNPKTSEVTDITTFTNLNGGVLVNYRVADTDEDIEDEDLEEYNELQELIVENWSNAIDTVANLYLYRRYTPEVSLNYIDPYVSSIPGNIYHDYTMPQIDSMINVVIQELIEDDNDTFEEYDMTGDFVEFSSSASVWYIGRFLDGFIFDTNISEVKELITGESDTSLSVLEYSSSSSYENDSGYIDAWYYSIAQLREGQWATLVTSSASAYGEITSTANIPAFTPLVFHVYIEPTSSSTW